MKIKSRIWLINVFSGAIVLLITLILLFNYQQTKKVVHENRTVNQIVIGVFELNILTHDYLLNNSNRAVRQFYMKNSSLAKTIEAIELMNVEESLLIKDLLRHNSLIHKIFSMIYAEIEDHEDGKETFYQMSELENGLAGILITKSQNMVSIAKQLSDRVNHRNLSLQQNVNFVLTVLAVMIMLLIVLNSILVGKSLLKPILNLQKGSKIIGEGNLDYKFDLDVNDEIGGLSKSFNLMTEKLKTTMASRDKLEKEIRERKQTEEELQKSEALLKEAQRVAHIGHWELCPEIGTPVWSDEIFRIFGLDPKVGEPSFTGHETHVHLDDWPILNKAVTQASTEGTPFDIIFRVVQPDGEIKWMHAIGTTTMNEKGKVTKLFGTAQDITEQAKNEKALKQSEEKYRQMFEDNTAIKLLIDPKNGAIVDANSGASEFYGYDYGQLRKMKITDINILPAEKVSDKMQAAKSGNRKYFIFQHQLASGEIRDVEVHSGPITYKGKSLLFSIIHDITERKQLEHQLQQAQKMESIGTLAGGIAHEFNNILTTIIGNTELAINDVPESNPARDCLSEIQTASSRAKNVVRQMLGFARKSVFQLIPVQISPIVSETLKLMRASIPKNIEIRRNLSCKSDTVMADSTQISQVLMNLCTNAKNAMNDEGGVMEVNLENTTLDETSAARYEDLSPGDFVKLTVKDTGNGIDPKIIDRIFEPYFTTTSLAEGTGMGLAVVHGIAKRHNGAITVESELGKGTSFEVLFPLTEAEAKLEPEKPVTLPAGNEKILFIDDEASLLKMVKRSLEMQGYRVETKTDPVEALELFRSDPDRFDLIITDMTMPNMTGDKLSKEILSIRPDMPIILCSGFSEKINAEKAKELGIRKYIDKPLDMSDFVASIRKVLDELKS